MWKLCAVGLLLAVTGTDGGEIAFTGTPPYEVTFRCKGGDLDNFELNPPIPSLTRVKLENCTIPEQPLIENFKKIGLDSTKIASLHLDLTTNPETLRGKHLSGLQIKSLTIYNTIEPIPVSEDLFDHVISTLETLDLKRVKLPSFPEENKLKHVTIVHGESLAYWGGCSELVRVDIEHWQVENGLNGWMEHCPKFEEMSLYHLAELTLTRALRGARYLKKLSVRRCALLCITEGMLADTVELETLSFTEHSLYDVHRKAFKSQSKLLELDFSRNDMFNVVQVMEVVSPLRSLKKLSLAYNRLDKFCFKWKNPIGVEYLSLRSNKIEELCVQNWTTLTHLDVTDNLITNLDFQGLPSPQTRDLTVDLRNNPILKLPDHEQEYNMLVNKFNSSSSKNVTVQMTMLTNCDCNHAYFARALATLPKLTVQGLNCNVTKDQREVISLHKATQNQVDCDKWPCETCTCRRLWKDNFTTADCRDGYLKTLPKVAGLDMMLASVNRIDSIDLGDLSDELKFMDLRNNKISRFSEAVALKMFAVEARKIRLSGNPIVCDCENKDMLTVLHDHQEQIEDYNLLTCVDDGQFLSEVNLEDLCAYTIEEILPIALSVSMVVAIICFSIIAYCWFEKQIKIFLFARGFCISCLSEEEIDADREFDAFISFCHDDDDFVNDHLSPALEDFKLCIHYRDWMAGEWIPGQIARSIEQSRRTIIVISKSYLLSMWGMMEFRMAHASALQEGRSRLIAIVLDDVISDGIMDAELRGYLGSNTYIRWGEHWFFDKLKYAMPRRKYSDKFEQIKPGKLSYGSSNSTLSTQFSHDGVNYMPAS